MSDHSIFYYPYASFTEKQSTLLEVAALYFDKLYILDQESDGGRHRDRRGSQGCKIFGRWRAPLAGSLDMQPIDL